MNFQKSKEYIMENREKLEIPTIEFTKVTLLGTSVSNCDKPEEDEVTHTLVDGGENTGGPTCALD